MLDEGGIERGAVTNVGDDELSRAGDNVAMALAEIVIDENVVPGSEKLRDNHSADVSGSASNQNPHTNTLP
jgi:hypothetical protein